MGTRSGDIDPGVFGYLAQARGQSSAEVTNTLNKASGLFGLSGGTSNDMRSLQRAAADGDGAAQLAVDVFVRRVAKAVAGLIVGLGRIDVLAFTGGIGENDAKIRSDVTTALGFLGFTIDADANADQGRATNGRITADGGPVAMVVPTDEELMIARDAVRLIIGEELQ